MITTNSKNNTSSNVNASNTTSNFGNTLYMVLRARERHRGLHNVYCEQIGVYFVETHALASSHCLFAVQGLESKKRVR